MGNPFETRLAVDSTMSLGDHLEELRARLIWALLGLTVGTILALFFGKAIIGFIKSPYDRVMQRYSAHSVGGPTFDPSAPTLLDAYFADLEKALEDPNRPADLDPHTIRFLHERYEETQAAWTKQHEPINSVLARILGGMNRLVTLGPPDAFVGYMKVSFIAGLLLSSPWVFYHIWMFVASGLYAHERRYVYTAVPFSAALFVTGALFFLFVVAPISLDFFMRFGDVIGTSSGWTFQKYISFVTVLMLVFGVAFQTPIAIYILVRMELVSVRQLRTSRKFVFLGMFVLAAVATPPDVVSQVTLALPLYALFELGILLCVLTPHRKKELGTEKT